jgi:hypothetical protein
VELVIGYVALNGRMIYELEDYGSSHGAVRWFGMDMLRKTLRKSSPQSKIQILDLPCMKQEC